MVFQTDSPRPCFQPFAPLHVVYQQLCVEPFSFLAALQTYASQNHHVVSVHFDCVKAGGGFGDLALGLDLDPLFSLQVVGVEKGQSLPCILVVASQKIDLLLAAEQGGVVPDGREERIEASVDEGVHPEVEVQVGILVPVDGRGFDEGDPLLLYLLEFGNFFLPQLIPGEAHFALEVPAKGGVQFAVVFIHGGLQIGSIPVHFEHYFGEGFILLRKFALLVEEGRLFSCLHPAEGQSFPQQFLNFDGKVVGGLLGGRLR